MNMRLIGARTIRDLKEDMVDTRALSTHIGILSQFWGLEAEI